MIEQLTFDKEKVHDIVKKVTDAGRVLLKSEKDFLQGREMQIYVYSGVNRAENDVKLMQKEGWESVPYKEFVHVYATLTLNEDAYKVRLPIRLYERPIEKVF